jgi:hypothetical protein
MPSPPASSGTPDKHRAHRRRPRRRPARRTRGRPGLRGPRRLQPRPARPRHSTASGRACTGCANELDAGYAADGYARLRGLGRGAHDLRSRLLSAINALAGAYAEHVPVVHVVAHPPWPPRTSTGWCTTLGDGPFGHLAAMHADITCARADLDLDNPIAEIDRALTRSATGTFPDTSCSLPTSPRPIPAGHRTAAGPGRPDRPGSVGRVHRRGPAGCSTRPAAPTPWPCWPGRWCTASAPPRGWRRCSPRASCRTPSPPGPRASSTCPRPGSPAATPGPPVAPRLPARWSSTPPRWYWPATSSPTSTAHGSPSGSPVRDDRAWGGCGGRRRSDVRPGVPAGRPRRARAAGRGVPAGRPAPGSDRAGCGRDRCRRRRAEPGAALAGDGRARHPRAD